MFSPQATEARATQLKEMIAQGGFASVHVATWQCTPCALKKIFDPILTEELLGDYASPTDLSVVFSVPSPSRHQQSPTKIRVVSPYLLPTFTSP